MHFRLMAGFLNGPPFDDVFIVESDFVKIQSIHGMSVVYDGPRMQFIWVLRNCKKDIDFPIYKPLHITSCECEGERVLYHHLFPPHFP